ncbi:MAG TPA: hypothetical protein VFU47_10600, partial [Armatimonadota bacterium]|nr:hypothetical protein [Armatimonadota bacterium]
GRLAARNHADAELFQDARLRLRLRQFQEREQALLEEIDGLQKRLAEAEVASKEAGRLAQELADTADALALLAEARQEYLETLLTAARSDPAA